MALSQSVKHCLESHQLTSSETSLMNLTRMTLRADLGQRGTSSKNFHDEPELYEEGLRCLEVQGQDKRDDIITAFGDEPHPGNCGRYLFLKPRKLVSI